MYHIYKNISDISSYPCDLLETIYDLNYDFYQDFQDLGAEVIGISGDTAASHEAFQSKYKLPFILLSDYDRKIRKAFGVPTSLFGLLPGRVTYVIHPDGTVKMVFNSMSAKNHITKALKMVKRFSK